jgi:hypothetical protein
MAMGVIRNPESIGATAQGKEAKRQISLVEHRAVLKVELLSNLCFHVLKKGIGFTPGVNRWHWREPPFPTLCFSSHVTGAFSHGIFAFRIAVRQGRSDSGCWARRRHC